MLLDVGDQSANLPRHGMLRRFLEKNVQSLNSLLIVPQIHERLSENKLRRAGMALAFGDGDLRLVARLVVVLLVQIGVGEQVVGQPVFGVGQHRLLQRGSRSRIVLPFQAGPAEKREGLGVVRVQIRGRAQVSSGLREILLLEIQIPKQKIQIWAGGRQLVGFVQMLLRLFEISRLRPKPRAWFPFAPSAT